MVPGRKFCTTTSRSRARSRKTARPSSVRRSRQSARLLRLTWAWANDSGGSVPGRNGGMRRTTSPPGSSTLTTSQPRSARTQPHIGPASVVVASSTRTPASGPGTGAADGSKNSDWSTPTPFPRNGEGTPAAGGPSGAGQPENRGGGGRAGGPPAALPGEGGDGHEGGQEPQPDVEPGDVVVAQAPAGRRRAGQPDAGRGGGGQPAGGGGVDGGHHRRHRGGGRLRRRRDRQGQVGRRRRRQAAQRRRLAHRRFDDRFGRHRP